MSRDSINMHAVVLALFVQLLFGGVISSTDQPALDGVVNNGINIIARNDWTNSSGLEEEFSHTPEYIVLSTSNLKCDNAKQCNESAFNHDSATSNFYIGSDSPVYEGRGWNLVPNVPLGGLNEHALSVVIFKPSESEISNNVKDTLIKLLSEGIKLNKTSKGCKYIDGNLIASSTERVEWTKILPEGKVLKEDEDINLMPHFNYPTVGLFPIVLLEEWNAEAPKEVGKSKKVTKIVIAEQGSRCFTNEECFKNLMEDEKIESCVGKASNFYIGDTGLAYEGKGWYGDPCYKLEESTSAALVITFMGPYKHYHPSQTSILALKRLIKFGLWLKIIEKNYVIKTIGDFKDYKDKQVGNELLKIINALSA